MELVISYCPEWNVKNLWKHLVWKYILWLELVAFKKNKESGSDKLEKRP